MTAFDRPGVTLCGWQDLLIMYAFYPYLLHFYFTALFVNLFHCNSRELSTSLAGPVDYLCALPILTAIFVNLFIVIHELSL